MQLKSLAVFVLTSTISLTSMAQRNTHEAGLSFGYANYAGDLAPFPMAFSEFHRAYGAFYRYEYQHKQSIRVGLNYATISGSDLNSSRESHRLINLDFQSKIYELSVTGEYNLFSFYPCDGFLFTPYALAGLAAFHFRPTPKGGGVSLQGVGTEGQGLSGYKAPYLLTQVSVPLGVGAKWSVHRFLVVGLEVNCRKTATDYLDDVSGKYVPYELMVAEKGANTAALADKSKGYALSNSKTVGAIRGNPKMFDWYGTINAYVSYIFNSKCARTKRYIPPHRYYFQCPRF